MWAFRTHRTTERLWQGPSIPYLYGRQISLGSILINALRRNLSGIAQVCHDDNGQWTSAEMLQKVIRCSLNLRDSVGLREGDVVGVVLKNEMLLTPIILACFTLGLPVNAVNVAYRRSDFENMFRASRPKLIVCYQEQYADLKDLSDRVMIFGNADQVEGDPLSVKDLFIAHSGEKEFIPPLISDSYSLPAIICCSSGTTGAAKGVATSHALLTYQLPAYTSEQGRIYFAFSTLDWLTGILGLAGCLLHGLTRVITTRPFSPELLLEIIRRHRVNSLLSAPSQIALLLRRQGTNRSDLCSVTDWMISGSSVARELCDQLNGLLGGGKAHLVYGSSEVGGLISRASEHYDSVGLLGPGISVRVVDDAGRDLGTGERGEVHVTTSLPMLGYYGNANATAASFTDNWWASGDVGFVDEAGRLHLVDRKKDIIKYMGHQVDPSEIERLVQQLPGVALAVVIGVPDPVCGDLPTAVIQRTEDRESTTAEQVMSLVETGLSEHKWLRGGVFFVTEIPLNASGKVLKRQLREQILNMGLEPVDN